MVDRRCASQRGAIGEQFVKRELNQSFGLAVDTRGGLIHHQDFRIVGECAREGQELGADPRKDSRRVHSPGCASPEGRRSTNRKRLRTRERLAHSVFGKIGAAEPHVFHYVACEQKHVLLYEADCAAQRGQSHSRTSTPSTRIRPEVTS